LGRHYHLGCNLREVCGPLPFFSFLFFIFYAVLFIGIHDFIIRFTQFHSCNISKMSSINTIIVKNSTSKPLYYMVKTQILNYQN
jgi:hypothetical protein